MADPDLAVPTLDDANQLGGPEFVAEVRADADAVADKLAPYGPMRTNGSTARAPESARRGAGQHPRAELVGTAVPTSSGRAWTGNSGPLPGGASVPTGTRVGGVATPSLRTRTPHLDVHGPEVRRPIVRRRDRRARARPTMTRSPDRLTVARTRSAYPTSARLHDRQRYEASAWPAGGSRARPAFTTWRELRHQPRGEGRGEAQSRTVGRHAPCPRTLALDSSSPR